MTFDDLRAAYTWAPLRGCPGRFVLRGQGRDLSLEDLLGPTAQIHSFRSAVAPDEVLVALIGDGGLISYRKPDGGYVHTLNTVEGLARKLDQLGLPRLGSSSDVDLVIKSC
jgi:hypothetical protein